ncbi:MAG: YciI family protein [Bryobacteraceae bacterium]
MKIVSFYDIAPDALAKIMTHYPAHRVRLDKFHSRGVLLAAGPFGNPPEGAMAIFTTRDAAEEFIQGDPFVINGLVSKWRLVEWNAAFI